MSKNPKIDSLVHRVLAGASKTLYIPQSLRAYYNNKHMEKAETKHQCPVCKSTDIKDNSMRKNNGVIGPGYKSWKINDTRVCGNCGVMFVPTASNTIAEDYGGPR